MFSELVGQSIFKKVLLNGLVVLVRPVHDVPKVALQLTYHVGAKDEASSEKGLAHLIEHMLFKGTKKLSETDWPVLTQKLSGYTNAFTFYDKTWYVFSVPSHHWKDLLPVYADTMRNCRFDEQMLNSELKAVIQELKMNRDNYFKTLVTQMISVIFEDHPYHYPVIGFKQDLWSLTRDNLFNFYQKHYVPNNAILTVVGDVDPEEVFAEAEKTVGQIPKDPTYKRKEFYHGKDLIARSVVLHRDVQQPYGLFAFVLPGQKEKKDLEMQVLSSVLGGGKSSRLQKKLVDERALATEFSTFMWQLEDATVFMMYFCARDESKIEEIRSIVTAELQDIAQHGITEKETTRALKQFKTGILSALESKATQAEMITEAYLFAGDEYYPFKLLAADAKGLDKKVQELVREYCSPAMMHSGKILSLPEEEKDQWQKLQKLSDKEDARILDGRVRKTTVEEPAYTSSVAVKPAKKFSFHKPQKYTLSNGLRVFSLNNKNIPKIELLLTLHARDHFDSEEKPGLYWFMSEMLIEGTKKYPGQLFMKELEDHAMSIDAGQGVVSLGMLKEDLPKGLELLRELLQNATFEEKAIEKVRATLLGRLKMFWDEPQSYIGLLARERLYEGHPYSKRTCGTEESLQSITRADLKKFYKDHVTAHNARISVVGDLEGYDLQALLEKELGSLKNTQVPDMQFPALKPVKGEIITHPANRDQIILMFAGLSIPRTHPDYDKLVLFDRMIDGNLGTRLFRLREQTGLFYSIGGSLVEGSDEQPGTVYISTIVSVDKLSESKKVIGEFMETVIDSITQEELETAKKAVLNAQVNWFSSNARMATAFLYLDRYKLGDNYFDVRPEVINTITLDQVKEAARKVLVPEKMLTVQIGRL